MEEKKYRARLIEFGKVINETEFSALPNEAYKVANESDGKPYWLSGMWVEVKEAKPKLNPNLNGGSNGKD